MTVLLIISAVSIRILSNSFTNVFQKKLIIGYSNALRINAIVYSILSLFLIPRAFVLPFKDLSSEFWYWTLLAGFCGACGNGFMVKALQNGELSVLGPVNAWKPVIGMLGGILLLSEIPSAGGIAGLVLIVLGSYWILGADEGGFRWRILLRRDIQFRFYALIFTALEAVFIKKLILLSSVEISFLLWCWTGAFFSWLGGFAIERKDLPQRSFWHSRQYILFLFLLALCFGSMQYATNLVFKLLPVSLGLALFQLSAAVNLWLGWHFFKEQGIRKKIIGTLMTISGAVLILLFK